MSPLSMRIGVCVVAVIALIPVPLCSGDDYLVIKKKDGEVRRMPLGISPDEVETITVEGAPKPERMPGRPEPPGLQRSERQLPVGKTEAEAPAKDLLLQPPRPEKAAPASSSPMIPTREPAGVAPAPGSPERAPAPRQPGLITKEPEEKATGPRVGAGPRKSQEGAPPEKRAALEAPKPGAFTINIYKLPGQIKALPDYSAFRPQRVVAADSINLNPPEGLQSFSGLPGDTQGLGLRCIGLFQVSGEGIFQWRINAKDGVRLHVDDKTLIENDGVHPAASKMGFAHLAEGTHLMLLDSFNSSGRPVVQVFVTPPNGPEEVFSASKGLTGWKEPAKPYDVLWGQVYFVPKANYPEGPDFSKISPVGRLIAPELNITGGEGFPGIPGRKNMLGVRYEGYFSVKGGGIFAYRLVSDHFAELTIGKERIARVAGGLKSNPDGDTGWVFLQEGSYPIIVDYFHAEGEPRLQLYVAQPTQQEEIFVPARPLEGFDSETAGTKMIPAFAYFLKKGTRSLPNFNKLNPSGMFFTPAIDYPADRGTNEFPGVPKRVDWLGLRFYVKFSLTEEEKGTYKFRLVADDGAKLIVGKKLVVNADGFGGVQEKSGSVTLEAGTHEMFVDYYQATGPGVVQLFITPPGGEEKIFAFQ